MLHLAGNVRPWIVAGLGGAADVRERQAEFDAPGPMPTEELLGRLEKALSDASAVLDGLDPASLLAPRRVQGFAESGLSILAPGVEHFSNPTGQIACLVKARKDVDLGFTRGQDLDRKG